MPRVHFAALLLVAVLAGKTANSADSQGCCAHCGCHCHVQKVCRLVCETKKVPTTQYDVKCDDICLPGHSHKCGCERIPSCGKIKTVKKLVKIEVLKEVPAYKCVVVTICDECCRKLAASEGQDPTQQDKVSVAATPAADKR